MYQVNKINIFFKYYVVRPLFFIICLLFTSQNSYAANLITNGDFSSGNSSFSSEYTYVTGANSAFPEGTYSVVTQASDVHVNWTTAFDHTSGNASGKYFVANSSNDNTDVVWQSDSSVAITQANTNYRFEVYISTLVALSDPGPELQFQIGDGTTWIDLGSSFTFVNGTHNVGQWYQAFVDAKFTATGNYYLRLKNNQTAAGGNDLGLDDISFEINLAGNGTTYNTTTLTNSIKHKDVVAILEAQSNIAKRFINSSVDTVMDRLEWIRRNRGSENLSQQGISVNYTNEAANTIAQQIPLNSYVNKLLNKSSKDWSVWTAGSITVGKADETQTASSKKISSTGITLGVDTRINKNNIFGVAIRTGNEDIKVGSSGSKIEAKLYSLSIYGSYVYNENNYIESTVGVSKLKFDVLRKLSSTSSLTGQRDGKQLFGSITFRNEIQRDNFFLSPYGRVTIGYTKLDSYSENGGSDAITFEKQNIDNKSVSLGLLSDYTIYKNDIKLVPYGRIEYNFDASSSSDVNVYTTSTPTVSDTIALNELLTSSWRFGLGLGVEIPRGFSYDMGYERNQATGYFTDTLRLKAAYRSKEEKWSLSLNNNLKSNENDFNLYYNSSF